MDRKNHFKVSWRTRIVDSYDVEGYTVIEAETLADAAEAAEGMVDVDFFAPTDKFPSAASDWVVDGRMWLAATPFSTYSEMGELLPNVEEWDFERIDVYAVEYIGPGPEPRPIIVTAYNEDDEVRAARAIIDWGRTHRVRLSVEKG